MPAKTQQDFLDLVTRNFPETWVGPLQSPGPGYEVIQAHAAIGARLSTAVERLRDDALLTTAQSGGKATCTIRLSRNAVAGSPALTVLASAIVATADGRRFRLTEDIAFSIGDSGPHNVLVEAVRASYAFNVPGPSTSAGGESLPGAVDRWATLRQDPPFADPNIMVAQVNAATGGASPMLDLHGEDRGMPRSPGENDNAYRNRVRLLPDTVSPAAIRRLVDAVTDPLGVTWYVFETFETTYQTCWDGPSQAVGDYEPNLFCWDDPREIGGVPAPPGNGIFWGRWLDEQDYRGAFVVVVGNAPALRDVGMAYDDTAMTPGAHTTLALDGTGKRAHAAYDVPLGANDTIVQGGYDGFDLPKRAAVRGLYLGLQQTKAAGVLTAVELEGQ